MRTAVATRIDAKLLEDQYSRWKQNPREVEPTWSAFFEGFELGLTEKPSNGAAAPAMAAPPSASPTPNLAELPVQTRVEGLVYAYRTIGHTIATLDPLAEERPEQPLLKLGELGFQEKDLDLSVSSKFYLGGREMNLSEMIESLKRVYGGTIGFEFMHIQNIKVRNWLRERIESRPFEPAPSREVQIALLRELLEAESFEHFLHTKYVGQKRFSLEGGESLMAALHTIFEDCPRRGVKEIVMGMSHRGRLNVLTNFLAKSFATLFAEFSENYIPNLVGGDGDVKYHLGYTSTRKTSGGEEVGIRLASNPSHLEAVNAVVEGMARARQRILKDTEERRMVLPLLLHGDAAFAGQGIVAEVLNMSQLPGYRTGGTVHIIINNQIGFTTLPADARSSSYATDVAKMIEAPVFHVNGDDPLAVAWCAQLAFEFRQQFHRDIVVDMYCYRRHGHNESDEPLFTQPSLYKEISSHPSVATLFRKQLIETSVLSENEADALEEEFESRLDRALQAVKVAEAQQEKSSFAESTAVFQPSYSHEPVPTGVPMERLEKVVRALTTVPEKFRIVPKVKRTVIDRRAQAFQHGGPIDWAFAETLAFGTLLAEKTPVRLSGQDSRRGTFSQRHSVLYDMETRERYIPLQNIGADQARFCVYNSLLSEAGVLGFDYGYSLDFPEMLCLWEAQFGDFANGAQVIIDQFLASAESKWQRPSGIVLLLPHGYEGQGPEHSSARLERYLQLCAEENIQVCNVTTPAQYYHLLRRQMRRSFLKPLVLMTPKSLLRSEQCVSSIGDFTAGHFNELLSTPALSGKTPERIILCTGKIYYDLINYRDANKINNAAIIRIEQLYPLDERRLVSLLGEHPENTKLVWCQEEPQNMGAWTYIYMCLDRIYSHSRHVWFAGRGASASPAVGALAAHKREQKALVQDAFTL
ncbi:MAG TPA: 2-oxoglutarate dehydrogenase E1 component [Chthoniobacteraceae bacterium]|jgi:2-oxoglutarate dehydrogenase E1 component|nr:2-oxoglutarate dehydrogenase E1 component [Chthoniobacteraceae bacterium]